MPRCSADGCSTRAVVKRPPVAISPEVKEQLDFVLRAALCITGEMGNIQLYDAADCSLTIVSQFGFERSFLTFFSCTRQAHAACGTALLRRERVVVEDVATDPIFANTEARDVMLAAGARAVQSTPLLSSAGDPLGMLSTHYRKPTRPFAHDLRCIDRLARYAARLIAHGFVSAPQRFESLSPVPEKNDGHAVVYDIFNRVGG